MTRHALTSLASGLAATALVIACGSDGDSSTDNGSTMTPSNEAGLVDRARLPAPLHPDASCPVTIDTPELLPGTHVPEGTPITYSSNPPSSGPHYIIWANFQEFSTPVELPYLVHSLEHGAILLLYKPCADANACAPIVEGLRKVRDAVPTDPLCDSETRVRVVIAPDPQLDVPVAAAAWGWTYKANCVDLPTLTDFAKAHYAQGTENLCAPGKATF